MYGMFQRSKCIYAVYRRFEANQREVDRGRRLRSLVLIDADLPGFSILNSAVSELSSSAPLRSQVR
jgi:hypothetical protein